MVVAIWGILVAVGLEEALIAVMGVLLLAAMAPLAILASNVARQLPGPLAAVAGAVAGAIEAGIRLTVVFSEASANALASAIQAPFQAIWTDIRALVLATEHLYWASDRIRTVTIPGVYSWTWSQLVAVYQASIAHADAVGARDVEYARQLALGLLARADAEFVEAVRHADAVGLQVAEYARQLAAQDAAYALQLATQEAAYVQAVAAAEAAYAGDLFREALDYARAGALGAEAYARGIGTLVEDYARTLTGDAITHSDAAASAVAAVAAAATAAVATRVRDIEDSPCQRFCGPLGDLGSLLQGLENAGLLALMVALVEEARTHPDQVADAIGGVVRPLAQDAVRSLQLGIA